MNRMLGMFRSECWLGDERGGSLVSLFVTVAFIGEESLGLLTELDA